MTDSTDDQDYDLGYGKPPKTTQWKPGQSGNPKGRPKKIKDFDKLLDRELSETVRITDGGETKLVSKRELIMKRVINEALRGDRAILKLVLSFMKNHLSVEGFEPDTGDREALLALLEKARSEDQGAEVESVAEDGDG
jgi:hypothetical protein